MIFGEENYKFSLNFSEINSSALYAGRHSMMLDIIMEELYDDPWK